MCFHLNRLIEAILISTQYTVLNIKKKITLNYPTSAAIGFFPKGLKNEFETAVVNEPPVFEPLKFYCSSDLSPIFNYISTSVIYKLLIY